MLLKPGPLDGEECAIINAHAAIGAQILSRPATQVFQMGERIALTHHEKGMGDGYRNGLSGEDIPMKARICGVADFFDGLTMDRPYRKAVPNDEVVEMILSENGTSFDPSVVEVFLRVRGEIEAVQVEHL